MPVSPHARLGCPFIDEFFAHFGRVSGLFFVAGNRELASAGGDEGTFVAARLASRWGPRGTLRAPLPRLGRNRGRGTDTRAPWPTGLPTADLAAQGRRC